MATFLAEKRLGVLRPIDEAGEDALRKIKNGAVLKVEVKQPRNIRAHRLFWGLMSLVWQQLDENEYPTVEDLAARVKIATGHRTRIELGDGTVGFIPKSIAFHQMDETAFRDFLDRSIHLVVTKILPGVTDAEIRHELEVMTGLQADAA
jgi:hypothetical protein